MPMNLLKSTGLLFAAFLLLGAAPKEDVPDFAKQVPVIKTGEPVFAFNGKDLTGMYTFLRDNKYEDPLKVFTVHDGMLHISGQEFGGITTKQSFKNYHLITEWKWGEKTWEMKVKGLERPLGASRDAGILLNCVGEDGAAYGHWMESIECQIIEGGTGDFLIVGGKNKASLTAETEVIEKQFYFKPGGTVVTRKGGRINWWGRDPKWKDVFGVRGPRDVEKTPGEWNRLEVISDEGKITNILNGVVVNVGTQAIPSEGKIQLQSEAAEIFFRKIEVRPIVK